MFHYSITNDGVTIAKEIELDDPFENMGAQLIKEVSTKTNDVAGDGTTSATVLAQAMIGEGLKNLAAGAHHCLQILHAQTAGKIVDAHHRLLSRRLPEVNLIIDEEFAADDEEEDREERKYFRAEVHLLEGGQDYDIMGWSREEVIDDILDQYEQHMHFLHVVR